ncbi:MAG: ABC transporter permease [Acidimicrobiales bacterium]
MNPVLARELRQRMRGPRAAVILTLYLLVLVLIVKVLYSAAENNNQFSGSAVRDTAALGRTTFHTLVFFVLLLVCFIVPSVTAGAIAGERARQTLVPLQVTLLQPRSILLGKLLASLAFVVLLIVATLPLAGISFLLGGVEPGELVKATAMVLVVAFVLASLSLACSALLRGTQGATVLALALTFCLCVVTFLAYGAQRITADGASTTSQLALVPNPFMALADVLDRRPQDGDGGPGDSPFTAMQSLLRERRGVAGRFDFLDGNVQVIQGRGVPVTGVEGFPVPAIGPDAVNTDDPAPPLLDRLPFWIESLVFWAVLSAAALMLAARRLAVPRPGLV